jgi:hypothetical protein
VQSNHPNGDGSESRNGKIHNWSWLNEFLLRIRNSLGFGYSRTSVDKTLENFWKTNCEPFALKNPDNDINHTNYLRHTEHHQKPAHNFHLISETVIPQKHKVQDTCILLSRKNRLYCKSPNFLIGSFRIPQNDKRKTTCSGISCITAKEY